MTTLGRYTTYYTHNCKFLHWILSPFPLVCQTAQFNVEHFSGMHNWYACSHARPTFCNVCKDSLSGVTSHGLSCEGKRRTITADIQYVTDVWSCCLISGNVRYPFPRGKKSWRNHLHTLSFQILKLSVCVTQSSDCPPREEPLEFKSNRRQHLSMLVQRTASHRESPPP